MHWLSKKYQTTQPIPQEQESIHYPKLNSLIQNTNQKVCQNIIFGKANFSESLDLKKKKKPFELDITRFKGDLQQYQAINRIAKSIQKKTQYYSQRSQTQEQQQNNLQAKISFINKNIRSIKSSIKEQKKIKNEIEKQKEKQAKQFIKKIKNPSTFQSSYNFERQLKTKSKSEGMLKLYAKNQINQNNSKHKRVNTQRSSPNSKKLTLSLKQNIQQRSAYVDKIRAIFNSKQLKLPSLFRQKVKPFSSSKQSQSKIFRLKNISKNNIEQAMQQIIFKKLNNNPQLPKSPRKTKEKCERIEDGNKMLKQSLKRVKTKQQIQISQQIQRIKFQKQNQKKTKIFGDKYLKQSLEQIRLPLQKFIEEKHLQSLQMQNYIKMARQQKKKMQQQKWTVLIDKIVNKQIDKYEGLIKLGVIQRKLIKLGDDPDHRFLLKSSILKAGNIQCQ